MSESGAIRVGVAGLGEMGLLHGAIFNSLRGSRLAAVADPSTIARNALAEMRSSARAYSDANEMIESGEVDAVVITTPVVDHIPVAIACVRRRIPFFMEKPLATSAAQARELVVALEKNPVSHMIGYMTRYLGSFQLGCELTASGCLGRLQRVAATIYVSQLFARGRGWRYDRKVSGGGVLLSQGSHLLDLLTWYFGPVRRVNAEMVSTYSEEIEDFAHLLLEFRSGLRGWVDCSWSVRFRRTVETVIDVLGDNGSLVVTDDSVRLFLDRSAGGMQAGWAAWNAVDLYQGVEVDIGGPHYTREDRAFLDALSNGTTPQPDIRHAFHVQQIVDAAYSSSLRDGSPEIIRDEILGA